MYCPLDVVCMFFVFFSSVISLLTFFLFFLGRVVYDMCNGPCSCVVCFFRVVVVFQVLGVRDWGPAGQGDRRGYSVQRLLRVLRT